MQRKCKKKLIKLRKDVQASELKGDYVKVLEKIYLTALDTKIDYSILKKVKDKIFLFNRLLWPEMTRDVLWNPSTNDNMFHS